jgi:hypothetical protein
MRNCCLRDRANQNMKMLVASSQKASGNIRSRTLRKWKEGLRGEMPLSKLKASLRKAADEQFPVCAVELVYPPRRARGRAPLPCRRY